MMPRTMNEAAEPVGESVDFSGAWDGMWANLSTGLTPEAQRLMTWVGAALVLFSLLKWANGKRKGANGSSASQHVLYTLIIGACLAAPNAIIPILLRLVDLVANLALSAAP